MRKLDKFKGHSFSVLFFVLCLDCVMGQEIKSQLGVPYIFSSLFKKTFNGSYISGYKFTGAIPVGDYHVSLIDTNFNLLWSKTIGGSSADCLTDVQCTSDGGYIIGGFSNSPISGDKTQNSIGNSLDYWIVKLDSLGNIEWDKTIGTYEEDRLYSICETIDGGYFLGGITYNVNTWGYDYFIVRVSSTGAYQWSKTIEGDDSDYLYYVSATMDGGCILGGMSSSSAFADKTEDSYSFDLWIVKTDSLGNIQWQNTINAYDYEYFSFIEKTADNGYILGASSVSPMGGDKSEDNIYSGIKYSYWIVKIDEFGNIQWENTIDGDDDDALASIYQTTDGGYILGGTSASGISGDKAENSLGDWDYWIVKIDSAGNIQWQNTIGGDNTDWLHAVLEIRDGEYLLVGTSSSPISGDKTFSATGNWTIRISENFNRLTGAIFSDINFNNLKDSGEAVLKNHLITELISGRISLTNDSGFYLLNVYDTGYYSVAPAACNYFNFSPLLHTGYFNSYLQTDSLNDFAFQPAGVFNDLCVTITPTGNFRAGMNASYSINFSNVGTTIINNCSITFLPDGNLTYVSSNTTPASVFPDSVIWSIGSLAPFQTGNIIVTVNVNVGIPIGTPIVSGVRIDPVAGDANPACNYNFWEVLTTGAVDPNDILVNRSTLLTTEFPNPPYLEYIIRFQNTGNDTAFFVKILNPIDTNKLQLNLFEFVSSSHPLSSMNFIYHERSMEFKFNNILLPDSNVNEAASHGFVRYRIKPKSNLILNDVIENLAAIYFDYSYPLLTNTANTTIVSPVGLNSGNSPMKNEGAWIWPNPAADEITFSGLNANAIIRIYDFTGRVIIEHRTTPDDNQLFKINIFSLNKGMYLAEKEINGEKQRIRFVKGR